MQLKRILAVSVVVTCVMTAVVSQPARAAAVRTATVGTSVNLQPLFEQPWSGRGNYMLDTEVYAPSGARVAQFTEVAWLGPGGTTRNYSWNTSGLVAGNYRIAQGVFTSDWSANRWWSSDTATVTLTDAPARSWSLVARTSGTDSVQVTTSFTAPSGFTARHVVLDTEIHGPAGGKVAQWAETVWMQAGRTVTRSYSWSTKDRPAGTYSVGQGVFGREWKGTLAWKGDGARFDVRAPLPAGLVEAPAAAVGSHSFWVDPNNPAVGQARDWATSRPGDAALMKRISGGASAVWLGGWNTNVKRDVNDVVVAAADTSTTPVFVAYNIPDRDCGSHSAGGAGDVIAYRNWIGSIADGIGAGRAWVVLEPDALGQLDCLDPKLRSARIEMLRDAVTVLESKPNVDVYVDAGHPGWHSTTEMAKRLQSVGVDRARGFSLNVSNFSTTGDNAAYGEAISALLGGKKYVVDTSRNGNGSNGQWCNPSGRAIGAFPTTNTGRPNADAFLWIKRPGESDGTCNGGPSAGRWWPEYALGLAERAPR